MVVFVVVQQSYSRYVGPDECRCYDGIIRKQSYGLAYYTDDPYSPTLPRGQLREPTPFAQNLPASCHGPAVGTSAWHGWTAQASRHQAQHVHSLDLQMQSHLQSCPRDFASLPPVKVRSP